jgi:hypothetical protein
VERKTMFARAKKSDRRVTLRNYGRPLRFEVLENRTLLAVTAADLAAQLGVTEAEAQAIAFAASTLPAEVAQAAVSPAPPPDVTAQSALPATPVVVPPPTTNATAEVGGLFGNQFLTGGGFLGGYRTGGTVLRSSSTDAEGPTRREVRRPILPDEPTDASGPAPADSVVPGGARGSQTPAGSAVPPKVDEKQGEVHSDAIEPEPYAGQTFVRHGTARDLETV